MRELKFRAWSEDRQKFVRVDYLDITRKGFGIQYGQRSYECRWEYPDDFIIHQFTGRCDKNGTEIYEGDILQGTDHHKVPIIVEYCDKRCTFIAKSVVMGYSYSLGDYKEIRNPIVIGNTIQNPELFKPC